MSSSASSSKGSKAGSDSDTAVSIHETEVPRHNVEERANWLSRLLFSYISGLMSKGMNKVLEAQDLWELASKEQAPAVADAFEKLWAEEMEKPLKAERCCGPKQSFKGIIFRTNRARCIAVLLLCVIVAMAPISSSIVLMYFIPWLANPLAEQWWGFFYLALFVVLPLLGSFAEAHAFRLLCTIGIHARVAANSANFRKALNLTSEARAKVTTGKIINLMSGDAEKLFQFSQFVTGVITSPLQIVVCLILLFYNIGYATFGGIIVLILFTPINGLIASQFEVNYNEKLRRGDERTKLVNELLGGMKVVKLNCYEEPLLKRIAEVRKLEVAAINRSRRAFAMIYVSIMTSPNCIFLGAIAMYMLLGNELTVTSVFVSYSLFEVLRLPFSFVPMLILSSVTTAQSANRIMDFLRSEEITETGEDKKMKIGQVQVDGTFAWAKVDESAEEKKSGSGSGSGDKSASKALSASVSKSVSASVSKSGDKSQEHEEVPKREITLQDVKMKVEPGSLTMLVGPVGSGKSSLLAAVLGAIPFYADTKGTVRRRGKIAYVPQTAWIINATVRDNILFGNPYDKKRFDEAIRVCALQPDLEQLPGGDQTEIGERGINLSGGQKQRVSIARAVYADADIYLFDDPLSAVDAHVGKHIFEECINGVLKGKTRILGTNQLVVVPNADNIVYLSSTGEVLEQGSYDELMDSGKGFSDFIETYMGKREEEEEEKADEEKTKKATPAAVEKAPTAQTGTVLVEDETSSKGRVSNTIYFAYIKALGGAPFFLVYIFLFILVEGFRTVASFELTYLSTGRLNSYLGVNWTVGQQLGLYAGIMLLYAISTATQQRFYYPSATKTSRRFFDNLIRRVARAPMSFFDTTPLGRVLNRFGRDMDMIDGELPDQFALFFTAIFDYITVLATIGISQPWFLVAIVPVTGLYYYTQNYFRHSSLAMQRLDAVSRSPIFAHFSETLDGVDSIRAYKLRPRFIKENTTKLDKNHEAYVSLQIANQWLKIRLGALGSLTTLAAGLAVVLTKGSSDVGLSSLAVTSAFGVIGMLNFFVTVSTTLERQLNSVDRVYEYTNLPNEKPAILDTDKDAVPEGWPAKGKVQFKDVIMSYRPGMEPVLRKVNFTVAAKEKIGIVGRSGSGKSSLMVALFRLVELTSGKILIDGVEAGNIGLDTLRKGMAIIPQDPVLFVGTVRENIDPFNNYSQEDVQHAIDVALLTETVAALEKGMDTQVAEGGSNFSVGQRQLLCLARAVLKKPRILVMDEATASVDADTDQKLQKAVRTNFKNCTVLTIAHRLNTIMDADKILVMSDGKVVEFDKPAALVDIPKGYLSTLVDKTGKASATLLRRMAHGEAIYSNQASQSGSSD